MSLPPLPPLPPPPLHPFPRCRRRHHRHNLPLNHSLQNSRLARKKENADDKKVGKLVRPSSLLGYRKLASVRNLTQVHVPRGIERERKRKKERERERERDKKKRKSCNTVQNSVSLPLLTAEKNEIHMQISNDYVLMINYDKK